MLTRVYTKWLPLLVFSGGTGISAGLVAAFAVAVAFVKQIHHKFSGGECVTGQSKLFFYVFCQLLAGKITYIFATLSRNLKYIGKLLSNTEIH